MCLFSSRPEWEEDVVFANRRRPRRSSRVVSETIVRERSSPIPAQYVQAPRASTPIIRPVSPPKLIRAPSPPPPPPAIELVSVEETSSSAGPRSSRVSVGKKSKHGSRGGEEVYIERERERVRLRTPEPRPEYDTYRYVEAPPRREEQRYVDEERVERRRSRSITYESNPRLSGRVTERERVVVEDGGRRREYYRRP